MDSSANNCLRMMLTSQVGMLCFLGFTFSGTENYFVNEDATTKIRML